MVYRHVFTYNIQPCLFYFQKCNKKEARVLARDALKKPHAQFIYIVLEFLLVIEYVYFPDMIHCRHSSHVWYCIRNGTICNDFRYKLSNQARNQGLGFFAGQSVWIFPNTRHAYLKWIMCPSSMTKCSSVWHVMMLLLRCKIYSKLPSKWREENHQKAWDGSWISETA